MKTPMKTRRCCDTCGNSTKVEYHVDPALWSRVTGSVWLAAETYDGGPGYHCLECFAALALKHGITTFVVNGVHIRI